MGLSAARKYLKQAIEERAVKGGTYQHAALYFLDIAKDAVDTFKPYKTEHHRNRDLFKFFYGLGNATFGITIIITEPFYSIYKMLFLNTPREFKARANDIFNLFFRLCEKMVAATSLTILGGTQIITSPLLLMRMPLRDHLSKGTTKQYFEDRKSIKLLVEQADEIMQNLSLEGSVGKMRQVLGEVQRKKYSIWFKKHRESYPYITYHTDYGSNRVRGGVINTYNKKGFCSFFISKDFKDSDPILQLNYYKNADKIEKLKEEIEHLRVPKT